LMSDLNQTTELNEVDFEALGRAQTQRASGRDLSFKCLYHQSREGA